MEAVTPEDVGCSAVRLRRIGDAMRRLVEDGTLAGAVTLVARRGRAAHFEATGLMDLEARRPMERDAEEEAQRREEEEARRREWGQRPPAERIAGPLAFWLQGRRMKGYEPTDEDVAAKRAELLAQLTAAEAAGA